MPLTYNDNDTPIGVPQDASDILDVTEVIIPLPIPSTSLLTEASLNFVLGDQIGSGGEGDVYKALDIQLNAEIAVKKVSIDSFGDDINQYFEESKKLYFTRHHHIAEVKYACKDDTHIYLAMPFYSKGSIHSLMRRRFLTSREIIRYSLQFLSGLNNIHAKGLIHFDIKPENILISDSDQAVISDFGLAQYTGLYGFTTMNGTTEALAPPEYFQQYAHNRLFDIYQAGMAMYRMCNGDDVFSQQIHDAHISRNVNHAHNFINSVMRGNFPNRSFYLPHIPRALRNVIRKALMPDPNQRYQSIIEMIDDLCRIESSNDWQYSIDAAGQHVWEDKTRKVTVVQSLNLWEVKSVKGNKRKVDYCKTGLSTADKDKLLLDVLNKNW